MELTASPQDSAKLFINAETFQIHSAFLEQWPGVWQRGDSQDYDGDPIALPLQLFTRTLFLPRFPCQMKRQKSSWKMKYASDVSSSPYCHPAAPGQNPLNPLKPTAKTTGGALNDAPATSYAMVEWPIVQQDNADRDGNVIG